jgi:hypothetical protein
VKTLVLCSGLMLGFLGFPLLVHGQRADTTTIVMAHAIPDTPDTRWMRDTVRKDFAARYPKRAITFRELTRSSGGGVSLSAVIEPTGDVITYYFRRYEGRLMLRAETTLQPARDAWKIGAAQPPDAWVSVTRDTTRMKEEVRAELQLRNLNVTVRLLPLRVTRDTVWVTAHTGHAMHEYRFERRSDGWYLSPERLTTTLDNTRIRPLPLDTTRRPRLAKPAAREEPRPKTAEGVVDTAAIRRLASEAGIDTTKAQLRVQGDTAWVWSRRDAGYSIGMELRRQNGWWVPYGTSDTTIAPPAALPGRRPPTDA